MLFFQIARHTPSDNFYNASHFYNDGHRPAGSHPPTRYFFIGNILKHALKTTSGILAAAALLTLSACGGGDGDGRGPDGDLPSPSASLFSGTAATGLPLIGTVTVKDSQGASKTVSLSENGSYEIDVSDMTGPFMFRAEGTAGGQKTVIHSVATAADEKNQTINITPLTDLIVANMAGDLASDYFDNGDFGALTETELDAEIASLKAKLLPVLLAMGVDDSIDLLRTAFTPLSSALDKVLDILRVSVDPSTHLATITNLVNQQQIVDDLATKAAAETASDPLDADGVTPTTADDITLIRKALTDLMDKFANGLPSPADVRPLLTSSDPVTGEYDFLFFDQGVDDTVNELASDSALIGGSYTDIVFRKIDYTITAGNKSPRAFVDYTQKDKNGVSLYRERDVQIVKGTDGKWRIRGDGRVLDADGRVRVAKDNNLNCVRTGFQFSIADMNDANSAAIATVVVRGPGLPTEGLRHTRPAQGGYWPIANGNGGNYYYLASSCANDPPTAGLTDEQIAAIPDDAAYTLTALDAEGQPVQYDGVDIVYTDRMPGRPLTIAEAKTTAFPTFNATPSLRDYNGGAEVTLSATHLDPTVAASFYIGLTKATQSGFSTTSAETDTVPEADGTASETFELPAGTYVAKDAFVSARDSAWREIVVVNHIQ